MLCPKPRWLIINDLLEEIHGVKKADAAEEWANALDAAESAAIEGRPEVSSIAVAIAVAREGPATYDVQCTSHFQITSAIHTRWPICLQTRFCWHQFRLRMTSVLDGTTVNII